MKRILLFLILIFVVYTCFVYFCPAITLWDKSIIILLQQKLQFLPSYIPLLFNATLYAFFIILPLFLGGLYFCRKYLFIDLVLFTLFPLGVFLCNEILKNIIQRARPPIDLQFVHPSSFSYVSGHTLVSYCLWGLVAFYLYKYCKNVYLKVLGILFACIWIISIGISRIYLGVHYPTDVLGAYLLGTIILIFYISIINTIGGKCR